MTEQQKNIKIVFLYVGIALSLFVAVISGFFTAFNVIDYFLSSELTWWQFEYQVLGTGPVSAAFLIVSFSVLFFLSRMVRRIVLPDHQNVWHKVCHIIIMIILTLAFLAIFISAALILKGFLSGDISWAFTLKSVFTAGVGAMVFYYYRGMLRGVWRNRGKEERVFVSSVSLLIVLLVGSTVWIVDPIDRSAKQKTYNTLAVMSNMRFKINLDFEEKKQLPKKLSEDLTESAMNVLYPPSQNIGDISYKKTGYATYQLCGVFSIVPPESETDISGYPYDDFPVTEVGENCFDFDAKEKISRF